MIKQLAGIISVLLFVFVTHTIISSNFSRENGAPPYAFEDLNPPFSLPLPSPTPWQRPSGPTRVGLQVGHWKNSELPDELQRLRGNTGSSGGGKAEWQVNLAIAEETKKILEEKNVTVELIPATVPPRYWADVFLAIHADGSTNLSASGFKIASPRRDYTGKSGELIDSISSAYSKHTGLNADPQITRNMTGYYAFAWWRYDHAIDPHSVAAILETGFLTNPGDRTIIVQQPRRSAQGIAEGILSYLFSNNLILDASPEVPSD